MRFGGVHVGGLAICVDRNVGGCFFYSPSLHGVPHLHIPARAPSQRLASSGSCPLTVVSIKRRATGNQRLASSGSCPQAARHGPQAARHGPQAARAPCQRLASSSTLQATKRLAPTPSD